MEVVWCCFSLRLSSERRAGLPHPVQCWAPNRCSLDFPVVQWLRPHTSKAGGLGLIAGQGTRSHMPQLRVCITFCML